MSGSSVDYVVKPRRSLSSISGQPLSDLVGFYFLCPNCSVVDRDRNRMQSGHRCKSCDVPADGARMYYPVSILVLVDLIQQSYHSSSPVGPLDAPQGSDVGPILYFCALREALFSWFLINHLRAKKISEPLIAKLFDDNKLANQKFGGLFTAAVDVKWPEAVATASARTSIDFGRVSSLMKEASEHRNEFLHSGCAWSFTREFATHCVDSVGDLIGLFVALHNEYTTQLFRRSR